MKKLYYFISIIALLFVISSCEIGDEDTNFNFVSLRTISVEAPESFNFNESHEITVTYLRPNDCTFFLGFDVTNPDVTTRDIVATASELADLSDCVIEAEEVQTTFTIVVLFEETYLLRFWTGQGSDGAQEFIELEIPVNN